MSRDKAMQPWVAECAWPGRKPFWAGTVWTRAKAPNHEVEQAIMEEALGKIGAFFTEILPIGWAHPEIIKLIPGQIIMVPTDPEGR